jgi:hypothetical protein
MADITMCKGTNCPVASKCYRYTAKINPYRQSYFSEVPLKDGKCDMYWGEKNDQIMDQLNDILKTKGDNDGI